MKKTTKKKKIEKQKGNKGRQNTQRDVDQMMNEDTGVGRSDIDDIPEYGEEDYKES